MVTRKSPTRIGVMGAHSTGKTTPQPVHVVLTVVDRCTLTLLAEAEISRQRVTSDRHCQARAEESELQLCIEEAAI
ncbi:hypothetical protein ABZY93_28130 [Streptomyces smyrnaeus]|uniref:hypothetical protein n=1 Tax=Streptomyces smyrnaeus TaxID=1387713 RepID=UPI0033AA1963